MIILYNIFFITIIILIVRVVLIKKGIFVKVVDNYTCKFSDNDRKLHSVSYYSRDYGTKFYPHGCCKDKWGSWRCIDCIHLEEIKYKYVFYKKEN